MHRSGYARSVWHSESFSAAWDSKQQELLHESLVAVLDSLPTRKIADIGCGTGRISRFLAQKGADVVGYDFSPATVAAAEKETRQQHLSARFVVADVSTGELPAAASSFDAAITVGCLAVACPTLEALDRALRAMARVVRPGGAVQLLEPIHTTRFFGRLLRAPLSSWIASAERAGLRLEGIQAMGFLPVRLALSSLDLPTNIVEPVFSLGERALHAAPFLERAADYRLLRFRRDE